MGTVSVLMTLKQPAAAGYNDRAQYFFDQLLSISSVSLGATIEGQINDFFDELIANGTIHATDTTGASDLIHALYFFDLGSAGATKLNSLRPVDADAQFRLTYSGGWTYNATGAAPNGTNGYADTHWIPNTQASLSGLTFATYIRTNDKSGTQVYGVYRTTGTIVQQNLSNENFVLGDINILSYSRTTTQRLFLATRRTSTDAEGYQDGTSIVTNTGATAGIPDTYSFYYGARSADGTPGFYSSHEISIGMLSGTEMSDTEAANFTTAVNNYATARGFNV